MGFGIDTTNDLHSNRKWGSTIKYKLTGEHAGLAGAIKKWTDALGISITNDNNDFDMEIVVSGAGNNASWSAGNGEYNGKNSVKGAGKISLGTGSTEYTILHEIGHMLGLCHEHMRVDCDSAATYRTNLQKSVEEGGRALDAFFLNTEYGYAGPRKYKNYGVFDNKSVMIYPMVAGQGNTEISAGDIATAKAINNFT